MSVVERSPHYKSRGLELMLNASRILLGVDTDLTGAENQLDSVNNNIRLLNEP